MNSRAWLLVIDPQRIFADPDSDWCAPGFASIVTPVDALVSEYGDRTIVTRWLPGDNRRGSWAAYFEKWSFADRPNDDAMFDLAEAAVPWAAKRGGATLDVSTFGKFGESLLAITGPEPHLVLTGVATDCCVISTALAAADAGATVEVMSAACAGSSDDNHAAALRVMGLYAPQITVN
jgi:nicotinamidase-related amidase